MEFAFRKTERPRMACGRRSIVIAECPLYKVDLPFTGNR